jgi:undecaprenyl diphosphate synthase
MSATTSMLERLPLFGKKEAGKKRLPKHIAVTAEDTLLWIKKNKLINVRDAFSKKLNVIMGLIQLQIKRAVPVLTILVLDDRKHSTEEIESLQNFFSSLKTHSMLHDNQVKVSVLGKWYDLPGYLVEEIKQTIDETKDYDRFFLNLCMNYNGHEEIVDSCRLIGRKLKAGKIDVDDINSELVKENLYSSYFLPPDLIIKTGSRKCWSDLLLWDSADAHYYFAGKLFNDFTASDFDRAIEDYNS